MQIANITAYNFGLFIHVLAVVVAFGPTFAYGIFGAVAERTAPAAVPAVIRGMQKVDRTLVTPGMVVLLLAGMYLIAKAEISFGESWVSVGFLAIIVLFGLSHGYFAPRLKQALTVSERDLAGDGDLSDEYRAITKQIETGGKIAGLVVVIAIFFMVVKP